MTRCRPPETSSSSHPRLQILAMQCGRDVMLELPEELSNTVHGAAER